MTKAPNTNEHDGKAEPMTFIARPPVRDGDTFAVLDDALLALAERKGLWLCDDLAFIHRATQSPVAAFGGVILLKTFQCLGSFPHFDVLPPRLIQPLATVLGGGAPRGPPAL